MTKEHLNGMNISGCDLDTKIKSFNIFKLWIEVDKNTLGMVSLPVHA